VRKVILLIVIMSFFVNSVVRAFSWFIVFENHGSLNVILNLIGFTSLNLLFTEQSVIIGGIHFLLPFTVLLLIGPVQDVKIDVVDAAKNLGANEFNVFRRIIFPLTLPGITTYS
jgi:spermidine/putrescine transport system permease protein